MPERATIGQTQQLGLETTEGTAVAAGKQLQSLSFALSPVIETSRFKGMGAKFDALVTPGKDSSAADISGQATYDEIVYLLCSALKKVTPTVSGTTGQLWTIEPSNITEDTVATYTVEQGSSVRAQKAAGVVVTDFSITFNRDSVEIGGTAMGQLFQDGITLTATPTALPLVPILPAQVSVYLDPTGAALGTTKLLRVLEVEIGFGSRFGPLWPLNASLASYAAHIETEPDATLRLLMEADAAGMAQLPTLRAGSTSFIRVEAVGGVIGAGPATYKATFDVPVKWEALNSLDDQDGVYGAEWGGRIVQDATLGKNISAKIINATTAL
jgi:hypothetical protein